MPQARNDEFWTHLDQLVGESQVIIDRQKDTPHPEYNDKIYPLDYGYLAGTTSSDGAGIDVWIGASAQHNVCGVVCTVDLIKRDSEVKILLGCTEHEMRTIVDFLNVDHGMRCYLIQRENGA